MKTAEKPLTYEQVKIRIGKPIYDFGMSRWVIVGEDMHMYYPISINDYVYGANHDPSSPIMGFDESRYFDHEPKEE